MYHHLILDLIEIFNNQAYLSIVLNNTLEKNNWTDSQRKLYTKLIYGVVEKKLLLDFYMSPYLAGKRIKPYFKNALRIGVYSIEFMNLANHYIVNELVEVVKKKDFNASKMVNGIFRNYLRTGHKSLEGLKEKEKVALEISLPQELSDYLYKDYKEKLLDFFKEAKALNTYRINYLKTTKEEIETLLKKEDILYEVKEDLIITSTSLINKPYFKDGQIIAQDASSAEVAIFASPKKGMKVLDVCAAPGGKSLHMATIMENKGSILSCDLYESRLEKINENAQKLGTTIIKTMQADATEAKYPDLYDIVLVDAPCSGLGVIGHKPDLKYHIALNDIYEIITLQMKILENVSKYVKEDGILVYSTCTINKQENEKQIKGFLKRHNEFTKVLERIVLPDVIHDGFYMVKLRKKTNE